MQKTLVVMAAGMGSRFGGLKQIEPVGPNGEFIIDYSAYDAKRAGYDKIVFVIKKEIEEVFDQLYGRILQSSRHLSFECCLLKDGALNAENSGPILEKAYIDMIPYNCFFLDEEVRTFLFYDQEFVKER